MKRNFMLVLTLLLLVTFPIIAAAEERYEDNANKQKVLQEYDEAHLIALAAATCAGTYIPDGIASEYSYLGEYGFVIQPYTVNDGNREANFTFASLNADFYPSTHTIPTFYSLNTHDSYLKAKISVFIR